MSIKQIDRKLMGDEKQTFGLRKTTLGLCGAVLASSVMILNAGQTAHTVHAATEGDAKQETKANSDVIQPVDNSQKTSDSKADTKTNAPIGSGVQTSAAKDQTGASDSTVGAGNKAADAAKPVAGSDVNKSAATDADKASDAGKAAAGTDAAKPVTGTDTNKSADATKPATGTDTKPAVGSDVTKSAAGLDTIKPAGSDINKSTDADNGKPTDKNQPDKTDSATVNDPEHPGNHNQNVSWGGEDQQVTINYVDPTTGQSVGKQILKGVTGEDVPIIYDVPTLKDKDGKVIGKYTLPSDALNDYRFTVDSGGLDPDSPMMTIQDPKTGKPMQIHSATLQTGYGDPRWKHTTVNWGIANPNYGKDMTELVINVGHQMDPMPDDVQTVTRHIEYTDPATGKKTSKDQTVTFTRTAQHDEITNKPVYGPWDKATQILPEVDLPAQVGYTSDKIPALTVKPGDKPASVVGKYIPNQNKVTIHFKDVSQNDPQNVPDKTVNMPTGADEDLTSDLPDGYIMASGQDPHYKVGTDQAQSVNLNVTHGTKDLTNDPSEYKNTHRDVKRIVKIVEPNVADPITNDQHHMFTRTATYDEVTKKVNYGEWSDNGKFTFDSVKIPTVPGYTPSGTVPEMTVTPSDNDQSMTVTYKANGQAITINYTDQDGNVIGTQTVTGETDKDLPINYQVPDHWVANDPSMPKSVKIKADGNAPITVKVDHKLDPQDNDVKTIQRTVEITTPDGKTNTQVQKAEFTRSSSYDEVLGKKVYGSWDKDSAKLAAIDVPHIDGYAESSDVPEIIVTPDSAEATTLKVTYKAIGQNVTINYKDAQGNVIGHGVISGKTGDTVPVTYNPPKGWTGDTSKLPQSVTIKAKDNPDIDVTIEHALDPQKDESATVTRNINITDPDGSKEDPIEQTVTFTRHVSKDEVTGQPVYGDWSENGKHDFDGVTVPVKTGYAPSISVPKITVTPDDAGKNFDVNVTYVAGGQTNSYKFVDDDDSQKQVGESVEFSGKTGQTVDLAINVPAHYDVAKSNSVPKSYVFKDKDNEPIVIHLVHHNSDVSNVDGLDTKRTVSRTVQVTNPDGKVTSETESVDFNRPATKDEVTGKIAYGKWNKDKQTLPEMPIKALPGYTATVTAPAIDVTPDSKPEMVKASYSANTQKISWVFNDQDDANNKLNGVKHEVTGETGDRVALNIQIPAGYDLADDQLPSTYLIKPEGNSDVVINLKHHQDDVTGMPGSDTVRNVGRTINITKPNGKTTAINQSVKFTRNASKDVVTGKITYGAWSNDGKQTLAELAVPPLAGYTPSQAEINSVVVTPDSKSNDQINITYSANKGQQTIDYVDDQGNSVGKQEVTGKTDETVPFTPVPPKGWVVDPAVINQLPKTLTIPAVDTPIKVSATHKIDILKPGESNEALGVKDSDVNKTVIRTITVIAPETDGQIGQGEKAPEAVVAQGIANRPAQGNGNVITQEVKFYRAASVDEVTGKITFSDWEANGSDTFAEYKAPEIKDYKAQPSVVKAEKATIDYKDPKIVITYVDAVTMGKQTINYVDGNGKPVGSQDITGKIGSDVPVVPEPPKGWTVDPDGEFKLPKEVTITKDNKPITVTIKHKLDQIDPNNPTHGLSKDDFNREVTRPIIVTTPDGTDIDMSQTAHFTRGASFDEVTESIIFTPWQSDIKEFPKVALPKFDGYAPNISEIPAASVKLDEEFSPLHVTYHVASDGFNGGYSDGWSAGINSDANNNQNANGQNANGNNQNKSFDENDLNKAAKNGYKKGYKKGYEDGYKKGFRDGRAYERELLTGSGNANGAGYGYGYGAGYGSGYGSGYGTNGGYAGGVTYVEGAGNIDGYGNGYYGYGYGGMGANGGMMIVNSDNNGGVGNGYAGYGMLPQTGRARSEAAQAVAATGLAIAGAISLLGLSAKRRKED